MQKHFYNLVLGVSVLPALLVMPAMADVITNDTEYAEAYTASQHSAARGGDFEARGAKVVFKETASFDNNQADGEPQNDGWGGAIFIDGMSDKANTAVEFKKAAAFSNNTAIAGGAIYNQATLTFDSDAAFTNNSATSNAHDAAGGALVNIAGATTEFKGKAVFTGNHADENAGAISNSGTMTFDDLATFIGNYTETNQSASVGNGGTMTFKNGLVVNSNGKDSSGNIISSTGFDNSGTLSITGGNVEFKNNTAKQRAGLGNGGGGKIYIGSSENPLSKIIFDTNTSTESSAGALFGNDGSGNSIELYADEIVFNKNTATVTSTDGGYGGAVFNAATMKIVGDKNIFTNNSIDVKQSGLKKNATYQGGGAIHAHGVNGAGLLTIGKSTSVNEFSGNSSNYNGGAIFSRSNAEITVNGTTFFNKNTASVNGGALYARDTGDAYTFNGNTTFSGNEAGDLGGAIYNNGTMVFNGVTSFVNNKAHGTYTPNSQNTLATYANGKGGAVYNSGNLTVGGMFKNNTAFHGGAVYNNGTLTVSDGSTFDGNYANVEGGAIANAGNLNIGNNVTFNNNKAFIKNGDLDVTSGGSEMGAAIYSEGTGATRTVTIGDNVKFTNNYSPFGNVYFLNSNNVTIGDNVEFSGNSSQKAAGIRTSSTGAGNSTITIGDNAKFVNNTITSVTGGAAIRLYDDDVTIGKNAVFLDNTGTAVYNGNSDLVFGSKVTFSGNNANSADGVGGALVNHGLAVTTFDSGMFTNNKATLAGGAIYNKEGATVEFTGDLVFSGNTAAGKANDIHNLGAVNISGGKTTLDGGITGNGALTIANGATLNIGTASIVQGTMSLDGTLNATLLNTNKFASLDVANFASQEGSLKLTLKGVGDYKVFKHAIFDNSNIALVYDDTLFVEPVWNVDKDTITVSMRAIEDIAKDTGVDMGTAAAVSHVAQAASGSDSVLLQDLSLKLQEKLAKGDTVAVEHATKAVHPETESVAQSVSTSVQNTVVSLASARMAAPSVGRNGGDVEFTSGGVWAQGLFNKSKQNDAFNGYTRGIALGMDGTINKDWTIGAGYSFSHSDISGTSRNTEIDSNTVFVYGQYKPTQWYVNAIANYTMSDYSERGTILDGVVVTGDYDVDSFGGALATGYDFANGITPELGLRYMHVNTSDYANSYGIKTHMDDTDFLTGVLGAKYTFNVAATKHLTLVPQLNAGVKYDMLSDKNIATVTMPGLNAYTLEGNRLKRIGGEFGIGLGMQYREMNVSVNYDIDVREDYTSQTGMLKFRYNF